MAFIRKVDSGGGDTVKFTNVGDSVTGVYLGSTPFEGKFGPSMKHIFKTDKGLKVAFAKEQSQFSGLLQGEDGKLVCVTFASTKPSGKGNPTKIYTLDVDADFQASAEDMAAYTDDSGDLPDDDTAADEVKTAPVKTAAKSGAPTASNQARVQALLNRGKAAS